VSALGAATVQALHDLVPDLDMDTALTTAMEQDLLVVEEDLSVRFAHPLVGSAVYARMTPLARRSLHALLAARAADPDARARHLALSTDAPDASVASLLEGAANRAAAQGAHTLASEFARHSLRITPAELEEDIRRRALLEVEHLAAAGEVRRALERADRLVATLPPGRARVEALMERAELEDDDRDAAEAYLLSALDEADGDDHLRGRVLYRLAQLRRLRVGDLPGAVDAAREALTLAERCGDARLELQSAAYLGHLETLAGEPRPDLVDRAARLETEVGTPPLSIGPRSLLALHRLWAGDLPAARSLLETLHAEAARAGNEMKQPQRLYILALVECAAGNLAAALERARTGAEIALDAENTYAERELLYPLSLAQAWLGREDEARASAERLRHEATTHGVQPLVARAASVIGLLALSVDDVEAAARELSTATELVEAMGFAHPGAFKVLPDTIEALARSGDAAEAAELLDVLERRAERTGAWAQAAAQRSRGGMMLSRGDPESAAEALAVAARMFDELGHGADAARALLARGRALVRAGQRALAAEVAAEARDRFLRMGAAHWHARAAEVVERAAPGRAEGGLTPAESRIAGLVARGKRNREIGQELYMSVATVEAHLTRIYRKLAIRSRSELARLVADGSLAVGAGRDG
jgi:DNA-binding NarL/FixJ family response regulator